MSVPAPCTQARFHYRMIALMGQSLYVVRSMRACLMISWRACYLKYFTTRIPWWKIAGAKRNTTAFRSIAYVAYILWKLDFKRSRGSMPAMQY